MSLRRHRKAVFIALGAATVAFALGMNVSWVVINWRAGVQLVLGAILFAMIIAGVVLNTAFLVREIRRNEQHNNFINAVTHELKTPVASIRLYLETLKTRPVEEEKRQQFYDHMLEDSDRLLDTIEQVLKAGQVTSGRHPEPVPVNLPETIEQSLALARSRHRLPEEALSFVNRITGGGTTVMGDPDDLRTAILNLLDNAVKYSGQTVSVLVELTRGEKGQLLVRVKDQGIGIPSHELKTIFERFHRIRDAAASRVKGTGLGLFIVNSVAKHHKGRVYAESGGSGLGSTFTLELPAAGPGRES
ncbi:MAG: HAMP domain-containing sensor histidine kinase [Bryobacteraceae bacterium]